MFEPTLTQEELDFIRSKSDHPYAEMDHVLKTGCLSETSIEELGKTYEIGQYIECVDVRGLSSFLGQIVQVRPFEIIILCVKTGNRYDDPIEVNSVHDISLDVIQGILGDNYKFKRLIPTWV